jgi:hypothetical protein
MRTLSIRTAAALAYERGEEFDPSAMPTPSLLEDLSAVSCARAIVPEAGERERRRRRRARQRRAADDGAPEWFSPCDLVAPVVPGVRGRVVHGELV